MKTKKQIVTLGLAALCVAVTVVIGCRKDEPEAEPVVAEPVDPVVARMNDPVYLKQLDKQRDGQRAALRAIGAAKAALTKAKEDGAGEEEIARLKAELKAAYQQLERNRLESQRIVAERMREQIQK